jgi:hypothetical protein
MPIDISDDVLSDVGQTIENIDFETMDRIQKMEFGKARTASILDSQTGKDVANKVKRNLSGLAARIGRRLKYYNRKDFPNQIPEGRVGFEVISENTSPIEVKQMLAQLEAWRTEQAKAPASPVVQPDVTPDTPPQNGQEGSQEAQQPTRAARR